MDESQHGSHDSFERARRAVARVAWTLFTLSFATLLVLSATPYWYPGNDWLVFCDQVWKVSGLVGIGLFLIPQLRRAGQAVTKWPSERP